MTWSSRTISTPASFKVRSGLNSITDRPPISLVPTNCNNLLPEHSPAFNNSKKATRSVRLLTMESPEAAKIIISHNLRITLIRSNPLTILKAPARQKTPLVCKIFKNLATSKFIIVRFWTISSLNSSSRNWQNIINTLKIRESSNNNILDIPSLKIKAMLWRSTSKVTPFNKCKTAT